MHGEQNGRNRVGFCELHSSIQPERVFRTLKWTQRIIMWENGKFTFNPGSRRVISISCNIYIVFFLIYSHCVALPCTLCNLVLEKVRRTSVINTNGTTLDKNVKYSLCRWLLCYSKKCKKCCKNIPSLATSSTRFGVVYEQSKNKVYSLYIHNQK